MSDVLSVSGEATAPRARYPGSWLTAASPVLTVRPGKEWTEGGCDVTGHVVDIVHVT